MERDQEKSEKSEIVETSSALVTTIAYIWIDHGGLGLVMAMRLSTLHDFTFYSVLFAREYMKTNSNGKSMEV